MSLTARDRRLAVALHFATAQADHLDQHAKHLKDAIINAHHLWAEEQIGHDGEGPQRAKDVLILLADAEDLLDRARGRIELARQAAQAFVKQL